MVIKVDLKKAYNCIEWNFLDRALDAWGFSEGVRRLTGSYVSTVNYSFLFNGDIADNFTPGKGLRQGDPLSPFLFIICTEILTRLINSEKCCENVHGIKISKNAPAITHLMYADDTLLMCRANKAEAQTIRKVL